MANIAKFDRDQVIHQAMLLFWEKGFHATSTRDLQQQINLRPGSFYAAFGSKEGLFKEALNHYAEHSIASLQAHLEAHTHVMAALQAFVKAIVLGQREQAPNDLCMLVKTIAELTDDQKELVAESKRLLKRTENQIRQALQSAQHSGELPVHVDSTLLASQIIAQVMGLRTYLRSSNDEVQVEKLIDAFFKQVLV